MVRPLLQQCLFNWRKTLVELLRFDLVVDESEVKEKITSQERVYLFKSLLHCRSIFFAEDTNFEFNNLFRRPDFTLMLSLSLTGIRLSIYVTWRNSEEKVGEEERRRKERKRKKREKNRVSKNITKNTVKREKNSAIGSEIQTRSAPS